MVWTELITILITSITSVVVALIGSGVFKKVRDNKEKVKSKEKLLEQINKDEIIHLSLRDIRRRFNSDRVYIWQFHNGGTFYTTSPMQRISISYERCADGLERKSEKNQNHLIGNFSSYIKDIMDNKMFYSDISEMKDIGVRSLAQSLGTKSHASAPIYDKNKHLVALICLDWVFSEIPSQYLKKDGDFTQDFIDEFKNDAHSLEKYL